MRMWQSRRRIRRRLRLHARAGPPPTMQQHPAYADVVREVGEFFSERLTTMLNERRHRGGTGGAGSRASALARRWSIICSCSRACGVLQSCGGRCCWAFPANRSSENCSGADLNERLPASLACATLAVAAGVQIIRAHDVAETVQAVRMAEAILSCKTNVDLISHTMAGGPRWRFSSSRC